MSDISDAIEHAFRELLKSRRYKSIFVKDICEEAHISRKTFYAVFSDKEGIVASIFKKGVIRPLHQINAVFSFDEAQSMTEMIQVKLYQRVLGDRQYYRDLVVSMKGHDDTFLRVATNSIYDFDREVLAALNFAGGELHADYISYFYASSQAMLLQKWICDDYPMSAQELAKLYNSMTLSFWKTVTEYRK